MPIFSASQILSQYWNNSIPVDPIVIAKNMGAAVYSSETIEYSGEFFWRDDIPTILYRASGNTRRDRFTIAHELGHFALNHESAHRDTVTSFNTTNFIPAERDANRFAAELLMPENALRFAVLEAGITSVMKLAESFDVSGTAMRIRLETLGFL